MVVIVDKVDVCVDIPILLKQKAYGLVVRSYPVGANGYK